MQTYNENDFQLSKFTRNIKTIYAVLKRTLKRNIKKIVTDSGYMKYKINTAFYHVSTYYLL